MKTEDKPKIAGSSKIIPHSSYTTPKLSLPFNFHSVVAISPTLLNGLYDRWRWGQPFLPQVPWDAISNNPLDKGSLQLQSHHVLGQLTHTSPVRAHQRHSIAPWSSCLSIQTLNCSKALGQCTAHPMQIRNQEGTSLTRGCKPGQQPHSRDTWVLVWKPLACYKSKVSFFLIKTQKAKNQHYGLDIKYMNE